MSGHSKWANIKHKKGKTDALKAKMATKIGREITVAARMGGADPTGNMRLKLALQKARENNIPKDNIQRAIDKGVGATDMNAYEEIVYEGYGPAGVAVTVEVMTDNRNRAAADVRHAFSKQGGNLGESGCVGWMFKSKGVFVIDKEGHDEDELTMLALEAGADILNDVWAGLYDGQMLALAAEKNVPIILMHNQKEEVYNDVTEDVCTFLSQRAQAALEAGVAKDNIWIDPGFGFAKNVQHNIDLLKGLDKVVALGYPVLFGISRKRVVNYLLGGNTQAKDRDQGTAALSGYAVTKGCQIVRVHNVDVNHDIVKTISGIL